MQLNKGMSWEDKIMLKKTKNILPDGENRNA
jgi:hypothetical protein